MIMELISYIRSLLPGYNSKPKRKRGPCDDLDLHISPKYPRISTSFMSSPEEEWLSGSSKNPHRIRRSFAGPTDISFKSHSLKNLSPIEIEDDDYPSNKLNNKSGKIHLTSTPNISKNKENGFDDLYKLNRKPNMRSDKLQYLVSQPKHFDNARPPQGFKFPSFASSTYRDCIKINIPSMLKKTNNVSADFSFRLDEKKKYEELMNRPQLSAPHDYDSFAEYSTPIGKIAPMSRTRKILQLATKAKQPEPMTNGVSGSWHTKLSTKDTIIKVLDNLDSDVIVVKDSDSDVEVLPVPPMPKSDFPITRINSLKTIVLPSEPHHEEWIKNKIKKHAEEIEKREKELELRNLSLHQIRSINNEVRVKQLEAQVQKCLHIKKKVVIPIDFHDKLPELSSEQENIVANALDKSRSISAVLVSKFSLNISRRDILTLSGLNWLNDEVINFYMNLIIERGKDERHPNVYAFNTFFYPKLLKDGHSSIRRWTRKIDVFSYDMICVPIHLSMHWCMAIIDFRSKSINYYDSMGKPNHQCTESLMLYLQEEHVDKKKRKFDKSDWKLRSLKDIPQQMNGSDCGVFSCTFAEFLTRNSPLNFSQDDMPYLRRKMVVEIISGRLLL